ncbi:MAG: heme-binding protein [Pseudonocardiales bacterium]|nr:heme-binding protein [Pseudonocardiales bacterium]
MTTDTTQATKPVLTVDAARASVDAALAKAAEMGIAVTVTTVDDGGTPKALVRMDGAPLVSVETARLKAYSAAAIGVATDDFFSAIAGDPSAVASFGTRPGLALIAGGIPLTVDGVVIGGVGVAGAMTGAQDRAIAEVAVAAATG